MFGLWVFRMSFRWNYSFAHAADSFHLPPPHSCHKWSIWKDRMSHSITTLDLSLLSKKPPILPIFRISERPRESQPRVQRFLFRAHTDSPFPRTIAFFNNYSLHMWLMTSEWGLQLCYFSSYLFSNALTDSIGQKFTTGSSKTSTFVS